MILHNAMLYLGVSHNLMPKSIMDNLGLHITMSCKYLFSFDSRKVKFLALIKDRVVNMTQVPARSIVMDILVADIPPRFDMLLS